MSEGAMKLEDVKVFDIDTLIDPYEAYQTLRDEAPVFHVPELNVHYVTRYDLIRQAIKDTETYSSKFDGFLNLSREAAFAAMPEDIREALLATEKEMIPIPPTMLTLDEPEHTKYRSLVSQLFTGSQVKKAEEQVQAVVDETADAFMDKAAGQADIDFMEEFAFPVPLRIIADRLGIPEADRPLFNDGATAAAGGLRLSPLKPEEMLRRARLAVDLQQLLVRLLEARRSDPRDDMITILATAKLEDEDRHLTHGEALSILNQFLVAGHETTTSTFGWGMLALCKQPELQEQIRDDAKLTRTFVEEALRVESPVQGLPRLVTRDTELGGYPIKAGEMVMLRYGAANRDERQFDNPDMVDVHREKAGMQLAFGSGVHHCIGAPLARQELNLGFPALLKRMQNIRLSPQRGEPKAEPSFILRNLPHLYIQFEPR
jgi:cytochrome P450